MRETTIEGFLEQLSSRTPAPGGGASAGLHAAQAAALLAMVARYSDGPRYAADADQIKAILAEADTLRDRATALIAEDAQAFAAVSDAYRLPKETSEQQTARSAAIAAALITAARPPAETIAAAHRLVRLAEQLLPVGNRNVITDVAAAVEAARAAAATARVNVEVNLGGITDEAARDHLSAALTGVDELLARADQVTAAVRAELTR